MPTQILIIKKMPIQIKKKKKIWKSNSCVSFFLSSILISKWNRYSNSKFQILNPLAKSPVPLLSFYTLIFMENFYNCTVIFNCIWRIFWKLKTLLTNTWSLLCWTNFTMKLSSICLASSDFSDSENFFLEAPSLTSLLDSSSTFYSSSVLISNT